MLKTKFAVVMLVVIAFAATAALGQAAPKKAPLSPPGKAETTINGKKVTVDYSRPSMRGRKIMGELVPYGQVWRTGANAATAFITEADLNIGGTNVPKGEYTLYSLPSDGAWKLIINKQTGQWGTKYDEGQDLARVDLKKSSTQKPVETFTISFVPAKNGQDLVLEWENTKLSVNVAEQK